MDLTDIFIGRPDLLSDEKKLKSTFSDYYAGDERKINRMMKAFEVGVLKALVQGKESELEKNKLIDKLVNLHDMQEEKAREAISEWYTICNKKVIAEFVKYTDEAKAQKEEAQKNEEQQKREVIKKKEKDSIDGKVGDLNIDYNNYSRYMNLDQSKGSTVWGIPCGVGNSDFGFEIKGAGRTDLNDRSPYPCLHALVYNFLVRDTHIEKEAYPQYMKDYRFNHELDYGHVYRFMMILLELLEPNGETVLRLNVLGDRDELTAATEILNEYLAVFSRLIRCEKCWISIIDDKKAKTISVTSEADICVENFTEDKGLRRRPRFASRVNYHLDKNDKADLEFILREISPFKTFKRGQFDALCSMMNANDHAVCIMPTGSGKSLIYYFACLLQPQVMFVVSPTDILIKDQIRNLRRFHHFDNVTHLSLDSDNDFSFYRMATNLVFLTPATFQNRNLFGIFKRFRDEIAYVVLDEVHCLSNWGHDFRPEYLMLSKNMIQYLENARYLGFTATANYTVAQDIQNQLNIPLENFFSPVLFEKYNVRYDFREVETTESMYEQVKSICEDIVKRNERAIVFTKSDELSLKVADAIGYEADVFTADKSDSYAQFAEGLCRILVASEELGIGINLPNVNCTVHFGIPVSKNEFVQEIGRAGRADEKVTSYVVYLKPSEENIPSQLLKRETVIDNLPQILKAMDNDYSDAYHKLNCGADTSDLLYDRIIDIFSDFHSGQKVAYMVHQPTNTIEVYKQYIYMLYVTGYVKDWYTYRYLMESDETELCIDICTVPSAGHSIVCLDDKSMLERMKNTSRNYFAAMGNDRESIFNVSKAEKIEDVFRVYVKWYYEKFLYHHKEQFLDFFEFLINNRQCDSVKITEEIEDYFVLPFIKIKEDEEYYSNMTFSELSKQVITGIGKNTLSNLERINSNSYSYRLDYLLFIGNWSRVGRFDATRLERFWVKLSEEEQQNFFETMTELYTSCTDDAKWSFLRYIDDRNNITGLKLSQVVDAVYKESPKDMLFYGVMARTANEKFSEFIRR